MVIRLVKISSMLGSGLHSMECFVGSGGPIRLVKISSMLGSGLHSTECFVGSGGPIFQFSV